MATIRTEIQELQDAIVPLLTNIQEYTYNTQLALGQLGPKIDTLNFNVSEIYERLQVLEDMIPAINRVGDLTNALAILTGGITFETQTKNLLDELTTQGNTLLAIAAALGLIKADTGNIGTIDSRLNAFIGMSDMDSLFNVLGNQNNSLIQITRALYAGENSNASFSGNPLRTLLTLAVTNLGNIETHGNGTTLLLSDLKVNSDTANSLLEEIRDCSCDDSSGTGLCVDYATAAPGVPIATPQGQDAVLYQAPGFTEGYACPHMFTFPAWTNGNNITSYQNGEWTTNGTSSIYGPGNFNVAIANTGTEEVTLFKGNLEAPGWSASPLLPGQCVLFNSDGWDFFCVGTLPDSLLSDTAVEVRFGTPS